MVELELPHGQNGEQNQECEPESFHKHAGALCGQFCVCSIFLKLMLLFYRRKNTKS